MELRFVKYQGTGNDFIVVDNRKGFFNPVSREIVRLCDRHYGIGSDGLILIESSDTADFTMTFYNPDASQSFCGNGSRCAVHFFQGLHDGSLSEVTFQAIDGTHQARIEHPEIQIRMKDVTDIRTLSQDEIFIHTGSPHILKFVHDVDRREIIPEGRAVRYAEEWKPGGVNVNFVEILAEGSLFIRTYERGVENETLSCGTGVTASALAYSTRSGHDGPVNVKTRGGNLKVRFVRDTENSFTDIWLCGPAEAVFKGTIDTGIL